MHFLDNTGRNQALIASIIMPNTGYLIVDNMSLSNRNFVWQSARNGHVTITGGLVHLPKTRPEFFRTVYPVKAFPVVHDGPDYEGAILSRQANQGLYD